MPNSDEPLWEKAARALGLNPIQIKWKLRRWRSEAQKNVRAAENESRWLRYQHKVCHRCGQVVDREERTCPSCQVKLHGRAATLLLRLGQHLVPAGGAVVTYGAAALCVVLYAVMIRFDGMEHLRGFTSRALIRFGAQSNVLVQTGGEWWRLVTANFLHIYVLHIVMNLWALFDLGPLIEELYGRSRAIVLIVGTGLVSSLGTLIWYQPRFGRSPVTISAGASGFIFGLIGAALVYGWLLGPSGRALRSHMARWAVYGVVFGMVISANNAAHIAGAIGGGLIALAMGTRRIEQLPAWQRRLWQLLALAAVGLVAFALIKAGLAPLPASLVR